MKKLDFGQSMTILANVGVLGGLIFLGVEIRQSSDIARASAYQDNAQALVDFRQSVAESEDLARLWRFYSDQRRDELQDTDSVRLSFLITNVFEIYQSAFYSRQYGIIGDAEWARFEAGACPHYENNRDRISFIVTEEFARYLEDECEISG